VGASQQQLGAIIASHLAVAFLLSASTCSLRLAACVWPLMQRSVGWWLHASKLQASASCKTLPEKPAAGPLSSNFSLSRLIPHSTLCGACSISYQPPSIKSNSKRSSQMMVD